MKKGLKLELMVLNKCFDLFHNLNKHNCIVIISVLCFYTKYTSKVTCLQM